MKICHADAPACQMGCVPQLDLIDANSRTAVRSNPEKRLPDGTTRRCASKYIPFIHSCIHSNLRQMFRIVRTGIRSQFFLREKTLQMTPRRTPPAAPRIIIILARTTFKYACEKKIHHRRGSSQLPCLAMQLIFFHGGGRVHFEMQGKGGDRQGKGEDGSFPCNSPSLPSHPLSRMDKSI